MLISTILTTGQLTFILRLAITILSSGGLFLVGLVVLGNAPRIASVATHDVLSRIAGSGSSTSASLKWLFTRRKTNDPTSTCKLALGIALLLSYSLFVKLSDVGLIGLYACTTAGPSFLDSPASVHDDEGARALLQENMVNGSDPAVVKYFRCDAVEPFVLNANDTLSACTAWINSTYADKSAFKGFNLSDTAVLMPRQLTRYNHIQSDVFELNGYFIGPLYRRVSEATIMNGLALVPHETGFRAFLGVPNLAPHTRVSLPQILALEADVGCMNVGMYTQDNVYSMSINSIDSFETEPAGPWRKYAGPDYLQDVVSRTVDEVRSYLQPMWNMSTLNTTSHLVLGINASSVTPDSGANVKSYFLPQLPGGSFGSNTDADRAIFGNCSERLEAQLNVSNPHKRGLEDEMSCKLMGIGGSFMQDGKLFVGLSRMVCATAMQVNLVRADIEVDGNGKLNTTFERLPSDLHTTMADWWNAHPVGEDTQYDTFDPVYRYALTPNPTGPTTHYIRPQRSRIGYVHGAGGGANSFPRVGGMMLNVGGSLDFTDQYASLAYLEEEYRALSLSPTRVAKWAGQLGASYILGSSAFNPWAADSIQTGPITVISTGGKAATCYYPPYAIAFVPLILAAVIALFMSLGMFFTSTLFKASRMEKLYAGLQPYAGVLLPDSPQLQTLLIWENYGQPRLEPVQNGQTIQVGGTGSAAEHLYRGKAREY